MSDGTDKTAVDQVYDAIAAIANPDHMVTHGVMVYAYTDAKLGGWGVMLKATNTPDFMMRGLLAEADDMVTGGEWIESDDED